ncbi:hypothetical protein Y1Q_0016590 [Alligator mississippiensis]|uniref:Uncharacterized protein n=1 Tax=Alligator mississippiensis TaxID=8496 RepID=A0A151MJQ9_ALLMI|nr:hypothetical protein Y1Q_0016590 [Alligator mississippiensis]
MASVTECSAGKRLGPPRCLADAAQLPGSRSPRIVRCLALSRSKELSALSLQSRRGSSKFKDKGADAVQVSPTLLSHSALARGADSRRASALPAVLDPQRRRNSSRNGTAERPVQSQQPDREPTLRCSGARVTCLPKQATGFEAIATATDASREGEASRCQPWRKATGGKGGLARHRNTYLPLTICISDSLAIQTKTQTYHFLLCSGSPGKSF